MFRSIRMIAATALTSVTLFTGASAASAQVAVQDGLVNVAIGDVTILEDVRVGVAAQVAANICGVKVGPVAALGRAVDRSGATSTVCTTNQGPVTIQQN